MAGNAANAVGTAMMLTGAGAPIGAVLVAGSLIYKHRHGIASAARWAHGRLQDFERAAQRLEDRAVEMVQERVDDLKQGAAEVADRAADWAVDKIGEQVTIARRAWNVVGGLLGS